MNQDDCHQEELSIFTLFPLDTSLQSREWIEYRPANQMTGSTVIDFNISAQPSAYVDLKNSVLNVKLRLTNGDRTPLPDGVVRCTRQLTLANHIQTSGRDLSTDIFVTRRYEWSLQSLHRHDSENRCTQENVPTSQLFYKDNGPDFSDAKTSPNLGLFNRYLATTRGKVVDLEGPLYVDLF